MRSSETFILGAITGGLVAAVGVACIGAVLVIGAQRLLWYVPA